MGNRERRRRERNLAKWREFFPAFMLAYIGSLLFRIPLYRMLGANGVAYFSAANEIYILVGCTVTYGLSEITALLVRFRCRRQMMKGAEKTRRIAMSIGMLLGIMLLAGLLLFSFLLAEKVLHLIRAGLAVRIMAPAVFFQILTGVMKGYFDGNGSQKPGEHAFLIKTGVLFAVGICGMVWIQKYGDKVSALLHDSDFAAVYGAMGAAIGILGASFVGFIYMLILFLLYGRNRKKQLAKDTSRNLESTFDMIRTIVIGSISFMLYAFLLRGTLWIDGLFYLRNAGEENIPLWGAYYGIFLVMIGIATALIRITGNGLLNRVLYYIDRDEYRASRNYLAILIHQMLLLSVPAAIALAVLSENIVTCIYGKTDGEISKLISKGAVLLILLPLTDIFLKLVRKLNRANLALLVEAVAFVLHFVLTMFLLKGMNGSLTALVLSTILSNLLIVAAAFFLLSRNMQYTQEWIRSVVYTVVIAALAGLLTLGLNKFLLPRAGELPALFISLAAGGVADVTLILLTKSVDVEELEEMPLGRLLIRLGEILRVF